MDRRCVDHGSVFCGVTGGVRTAHKLGARPDAQCGRRKPVLTDSEALDTKS
jgi:hypothetical protein